MLQITDIKAETKRLIEWIRMTIGTDPQTQAVIGISGGKDSTIAAALCVEALGAGKVIGVLMPNGEQSDFDDAVAVAKYLDLQYCVINIHDACEAEYAALKAAGFEYLPDLVYINTPPRIRMATLYNIAQTCHGRVVNTSNLSERYVGWSTKWGDGVGDIAPLAELTVSEVLAIGKELGIPDKLLYKTPADGLTGKSDEENLDVSYDDIDKMVRQDGIPDRISYCIIAKRHEASRHKDCLRIPTFFPRLEQA